MTSHSVALLAASCVAVGGAVPASAALLHPRMPPFASGRRRQQPTAEAGPASADELALEQSRIADKYAKLEQLMLKMAELEGASNPKRAALLTRAVEQSKERLTKTQLETLVKLLNQKQLKRAIDGQATVQTDLKALLELLMSEDRSDRLKSEQQRIQEYIKEVERLIRLEKSVQGQTEGGADAKQLAKEQGRIAGQTGDLAQKIQENEEGGKPTEGQPKEGERRQARRTETRRREADGRPAERGQTQRRKAVRRQSRVKGSPAKGSPRKAKPSEGKPAEGKPREGKPGEEKPMEGKAWRAETR